MASLLRGQARKFENITKSLDKSISKSIKRYRKNREKAARIETIKKAYDMLDDIAKINLKSLGRVRGFNPEKLVDTKTSQIIKNKEIAKQFKNLEKSLLTKKKGIEYVKTTGEIYKTASKAKGVEKAFKDIKKFKKGKKEVQVGATVKDIAEQDKNNQLYQYYQYFLQFDKYKKLQKSMTYEEFKKFIASAGYYDDISDEYIDMYEKAEAVYDKIVAYSQLPEKDGNKVFAASLNSGHNSSNKREEEKSGFFGRGNKGMGEAEKGVYNIILDRIKANKNASVDDIVRDVLDDIKTNKSSVRTSLKDRAKVFNTLK